MEVSSHADARESDQRVIQIAVAMLVSEGRVLMAHRRADRRWYPDCWDLIGGHVESGETPAEAVHRECTEEIGVEIQAVRGVPFAFSDPTIEMHAFLVTDWVGHPTNTAPEEHDDLRWYHPDELATLTLADPTSLPDLLSAVESAS